MMKTAFAFILLLLSLIGCGETETPPPEQEQPRYEGTIVAMGDSLTAGLGLSEEQAYPARLERKLHSDGYAYRVVNGGISGETSSGALSRTKWMLSLKPDIVILETGANDGLRGIDPDVTKKNMNEIVRILKEHKVTVVLAGMKIVHNLGEEYTNAFMEIYPAVAEKQNLILSPFFLEGIAGDPGLNQSDGIHPNEEGYRRVVETIYPYVIEAINERKNRGTE
jgi:acyl-CoA thioesterase-1